MNTLAATRRDQVLSLFDADWDIPDIAVYLDLTESRVQTIIDAADIPHLLPEKTERESSGKGHVRSQAAADGQRNTGPRRQPHGPVMSRDDRWPHTHGTTSGYRRHLKEGTPPCGACTQAKRDKLAAARRAAGKPERPYRVKERLT